VIGSHPHCEAPVTAGVKPPSLSLGFAAGEQYHALRSIVHSSPSLCSVRRRDGMSEVGRPSVSGLPALPADVWAAIARATLRAEGDHAHAWERLRRVNSTWRAALEGGSAFSRTVHLQSAVILHSQARELTAKRLA